MQEALHSISNGLYIIGACNSNHYAGALVDAITQISASPPLIVLSLMNTSHTLACIKQYQEFSLSVLAKDTDPFVIANFGYQSGHNTNKWQNIDYEQNDSLPYIPNAIAKIKLKVNDIIAYPNNTLIIAEAIKHYGIIDNKPLTYKYYREQLKPLCQNIHQKHASCPVSGSLKEVSSKQNLYSKHWECTICQYIYDGKDDFISLPKDWRCPYCGVSKDMFKLT